MTRTIAVAGLLFAIGCSPSRSSTPTDAAATEAAGEGVAGECNQVTQQGALISNRCAGGDPPAAAGGTIVDGTYVLTDSRLVGDCSSAPLAETLIVLTGEVQSLVTTADGATIRKNLQYDVNDTIMVQRQTCPDVATTRAVFSATPTTITIALANALATRVSIFTRL